MNKIRVRIYHFYIVMNLILTFVLGPFHYARILFLFIRRIQLHVFILNFVSNARIDFKISSIMY